MKKNISLLILSFYLLGTLLLSGCSSSKDSAPLGEGTLSVPSYTITAPKTGKILGLILEKGERISKDQPLFAIEDKELDQQVENLATELAKLQAQLKAMEQGKEDLSSGPNLAKLKSNYETAQSKANKMNQLLAAGAVSRKQAQQAQLELQSASAALQAASQSNHPATPEELELQKQKIQQLEQKQQQLLTAQQKNEAFSPCTAVVTESYQKNGQQVEAQQPILVLKAQDVATIFCSQANKAALPPVGSKVIIKVKDSDISFPGTVSGHTASGFTVSSNQKPETLAQDTKVIILLN